MSNSLKEKLSKLVDDFIEAEAHKASEERIQSLFILDLLSHLGWEKRNLIINEGPEVKTGKKPDIQLISDTKETLFVIESKDVSDRHKLDGKYKSQTFTEQLFGYCEGNGIYWGVLTNFIEWRVYNSYQKRLYHEKKYAFHRLLWKDADKANYIDLESKEGIEFLEKLRKEDIITSKGIWDSDTVYYPKQEEIKEKFFTNLKAWRSTLRNAISEKAKRDLSVEEIDLQTQKILDRLIFVDFCSDNGILPQDRLHAVLFAKKDLSACERRSNTVTLAGPIV